MTSQPNPSRRVDAVDRRRENALARLPRALFTTAQAHAAGLTRSDLRSDAVIPVLRGVYTHRATQIDHHLRCRATLLVTPRAARIAGLSAARLLGLPVPHDDRVTTVVTGVCATHTRGGRRAQGDASVHVWVRNADGDAALPVTSHPRLLGECLEQLPLVDAVVLGDAIANRLRPGAEQIRPARAVLQSRWRAVSCLVGRGSESPMESRLRMLLSWPASTSP